MENTTCGQNCPFVKIGFCNCDKDCPNYHESWWIESKSQETKLLKDCIPKRMIIQQQYMQSRMEGVQASLEQSRNEYNQLAGYLKNLVEMAKMIVVSDQTKQIAKGDSNENNNLIDVDRNSS